MITSCIPFFLSPCAFDPLNIILRFRPIPFILATQILSPSHACFSMLRFACSVTFVSHWALCSTYKPVVIDLLTQSFVTAQTTEFRLLAISTRNTSQRCSYCPSGTSMIEHQCHHAVASLNNSVTWSSHIVYVLLQVGVPLNLT